MPKATMTKTEAVAQVIKDHGANFSVDSLKNLVKAKYGLVVARSTVEAVLYKARAEQRKAQSLVTSNGSEKKSREYADEVINLIDHVQTAVQMAGSKEALIRLINLL